MDFDFILWNIILPGLAGGIAGPLLGPYVAKFLDFLWEKIRRMMRTLRNLSHKPPKERREQT